MYFDRFDICEAYWVFWSLWHASGVCMHPISGREIGARLHRVKFKPRDSLCLETLEENARAIYDALEAAEERRSRTPVPVWAKCLRAFHEASKS